MSKHCEKNVNLNIGLADCCGEKKEKKRKKTKQCCLMLPVCGSIIGELLPEGGDPGDHLVKDGENKPMWKPAKECNCDPDDQLPEGGEPGDHLVKDEYNNPIWKPANECDCEPGDHLPDGGEPNDVLIRDGDNNAVWKPINECNCEPSEGLPDGGEPNDVLIRDGDNNAVWKPINECNCEPSEGLPDGGEPNDVLTRDGNNNPVWKRISQCDCVSMDYLPTPGTGALRNEAGCTQVEDPIEDKDATNKRWIISLIAETSKTMPTAAQTFYFRTDGNDNNSGLANNAAEAFKTAQGGINAILSRQYTSPYLISLKFATGKFGPMRFDASALSVLPVDIQGNSVATIFDATNDVPLYVTGGSVRGSNMKVLVDGGSNYAYGRAGILLGGASTLSISGNIEIEISQSSSAYGWEAICVNSLATFSFANTVKTTFKGNPTHAVSNYGTCTFNGIAGTHTQTVVVGGLSASGFYYGAQLSSFIRAIPVAFSGSQAGIGYRYFLGSNAVCTVDGMGENFFPGTTAGSKSTGAVYS